MKTLVTAVAAVLFSLTAFSQESTFNDSTSLAKTRAEVNAEVMAAIVRGERLVYGEAGPTPTISRASSLTRAQVGAELMSAIGRGEGPRTGDARPDPVQPNTSTLTRAEVRADLMEAYARSGRPRTGEGREYPLPSQRAHGGHPLALRTNDNAVATR